MPETRPDFVEGFVDRLRTRAADPLLGESAEARLLVKLAEEIEREYVAHQDERLTPRAAAEESGFTVQAIRVWRAEGRISDRRRDLPRKPGHGVQRGPQAVPSTPSIADRVLSSTRRRRAS